MWSLSDTRPRCRRLHSLNVERTPHRQYSYLSEVIPIPKRRFAGDASLVQTGSNPRVTGWFGEQYLWSSRRHLRAIRGYASSLSSCWSESAGSRRMPRSHLRTMLQPCRQIVLLTQSSLLTLCLRKSSPAPSRTHGFASFSTSSVAAGAFCSWSFYSCSVSSPACGTLRSA